MEWKAALVYLFVGSIVGGVIGLLFTTGMCTAGVWISTHVVAACHRNYPRQAMIASLEAAGLLLFTADSFSSLSMKLMSHYGIGYSHKFNLRVNDEGAKTVRELKLQCEESYHYLCDVEILSKMGGSILLKSRWHDAHHPAEVRCGFYQAA
jgi:hypothetical protein